jgi:hypothetical protein
MKSIERTKPWRYVKGQGGNPGGIPKHAKLINEEMREIHSEVAFVLGTTG